jgi:hypothetical protein
MPCILKNHQSVTQSRKMSPKMTLFKIKQFLLPEKWCGKSFCYCKRGSFLPVSMKK